MLRYYFSRCHSTECWTYVKLGTCALCFITYSTSFYPQIPCDVRFTKKHYLNVASLFSVVKSISDIIPADHTYQVNEKWKLWHSNTTCSDTLRLFKFQLIVITPWSIQSLPTKNFHLSHSLMFLLLWNGTSLSTCSHSNFSPLEFLKPFQQYCASLWHIMISKEYSTIRLLHRPQHPTLSFRVHILWNLNFKYSNFIKNFCFDFSRYLASRAVNLVCNLHANDFESPNRGHWVVYWLCEVDAVGVCCWGHNPIHGGAGGEGNICGSVRESGGERMPE